MYTDPADQKMLNIFFHLYFWYISKIKYQILQENNIEHDIFNFAFTNFTYF